MIEPNKLSLRLQRKLETGKIKLPKFLRLCAYWSFRYLDGMVPIVNKMEKPKQLTNIPTLGAIERRKLMHNAEFWNKDYIKGYLDEEERCKHENRANYKRLKEMLNLIPDADCKDKIEKRITTFKKYFIWKGEMIPKVDNIFEGTVVS